MDVSASSTPPCDWHGAGDIGTGLLRDLLDETGDLVFCVGPDLRLTFVNRPVKVATACRAAQLLGQPVGATRLFGTAAMVVQEFLRSALAEARLAGIEVAWLRSEGTRIYALHAVPDVDADGAARALVVRAQNITGLRRTEQDLRAREHAFRTLAENSPDNIIRYGLDARAVYCNREIEQRVANASAGSVIGRTPVESRPPGMVGAEQYEARLRHTLATGEPGTCELRLLDPAGDVRIHQIRFAAERDADGRIHGAVAVGRDITDEAVMRQALAEKERDFRTLAENAADNIIRWDTAARVMYMNPAMARMFGHGTEDRLGMTPADIAPDGEFQDIHDAVLRVAGTGRTEDLELRFPVDGVQHIHHVHLIPERDESGWIRSVLGIGRDITERMAHLELIESLLRTDSLTRLANRQALQERAPGVLAGVLRRGGQAAVMLLDLDQFKAVNDGMGHSAGDELLRGAAERLRGALRADDLLARLGGDEFVVVAPDITGTADIAAIAEHLHGALCDPLPAGGRSVRVTASIGVAVFPGDGDGLEDLLAHADSAMYHAKRNGRGGTEYYRSELGDEVHRRLLLEESLRLASAGEGLELYFQPIVSLDDPFRVEGAEALLRWNHPTLGLLSPDAFIAAAEETGSIVPMGRWVLAEAARAAVRWNRGRDEPLRIAVNVSTRQFTLDDVVGVVDAVLEETACEPSWLSVEITESALLEDSRMVHAALEAFRDRGMRVAIDDFGTGYSALNYLVRFPMDCLKIDRSFVQGIGRSERDDELVKAFIAMATALNLSTVAEGIETGEQAVFLRAHGCESGQGYRFGRPMPAARFAREVLGITAPVNGLRRPV
ncbi:MAG: EAL domain-containing protein [Thermoleophilia bacterium]